MPRLSAPVLAPGKLRASPQPILKGLSLKLRPWADSDATAVFAAYQDPAIQRWHDRIMVDEEEARAWIAAAQEGWRAETHADWAVEIAQAVAGRVSLRGIDGSDGCAEVGYWVLPASRGRGIASAAVRLLADWALHGIGLHRLSLEHSINNEASCRVALAAGFLPEGTRRSVARHADGWHDMHVHARFA